MMTDMTAAARPLVLKDKDGKEVKLLFSPLSDKDIIELDEWVRAEFLKTVRRSLDDEKDEDVIIRETTIAQKTALGISWMSGVGARLVATPIGMAQLVFQSCKISESSLTLEKIVELMFNPANIQEVNRTFSNANPTKEGKRKQGKKPTAVNRRQVKRKSTGRSRKGTGTRQRK